MALGDPYIEPGRLAAYLHVEDSDDDTEFLLATTAASRWVNQHCGRDFQTAAAVSARVFRAMPCSPRTYIDDFSTATGLIVKVGDNRDGTWATTLATTAYDLEPFPGSVSGVPGHPFNQIVMRSGQFYAGTIQVTAKWGWAEVPADVKLATLIQAARLFARRESPEGVIGGFESPLRVGARVDPDVEALLQPYVRMVGFA